MGVYGAGIYGAGVYGSGGGVTATPQPGNSPPRVQLTLVGLSGSSVRIVRVDPDGTRPLVRAFNPAVLTGGGAAGFDYEAPFGQPVTYIATTDTGAIYTSATVTVAATSPWLIHPGIPALSQPLSGLTLGDETQDTSQGVHVILGRSDPIVRSDGVRHSPVFDLFTTTTTAADGDALRKLLSDGSVLLLQIAYPYTPLTDYYWVSVGVVTRKRVTTDYGQSYYPWTLPCTVTSSPAGLLQAQWTCAGVVAAYATCADVAARYATSSDLLINYPIPA